MNDAGPLYDKVLEIIAELKLMCLWKNEPPAWVISYQKKTVVNQGEFLEWLQFVYLPNMVPATGNYNILQEKNYVAPQAIKFLDEGFRQGKLLQLLIELDALT